MWPNKWESLVIIIICGIYGYVGRPIVCRKKIYKHVISLGGTVYGIEKVSTREEIYLVHYRIGEEYKDNVVKFNFLYNQDWK